ncbi:MULTISPECIES: NAD(P)H-dependent glycerol-3-phosphate dehydrogenase [Neisseria]|uniref:Glycerol-3-phosphate dehydrogenase [NAD(P)+] n=1 Tax=Neisseria musculi TaxID=1815583 RepID=A0A7H1MD99_9NEIS|nr:MULTISPECIES: NAD(P)H-dependent glycerol-3-phosphate dehydrogenase [Neisseria]MBF0803939.1 NAD(P)-dependent glycerol-3-phosphate dehydrogenase [Neisseria sp. 19428wB4_WF04]QNT59614.1 NAD binding domain of 6-phosphogluconate dehydrogenase family protein [Neisseria musculi]TFU43366.1 NAD(P)-dependent glycerol-3-phosphate dehydrogenase [Neisseria sp. WF04]
MKITIIGAGSWGTALAIHFALHGHETAVWSRNREHMENLRRDRENKRYLPGFALPAGLGAHTSLSEALEGAELVLIATSVAGLRGSAGLLAEHGAGHLPVLTACKGFEQDTGLLTFQVVKEVLPDNPDIGVLSGPSFAQELAQQLPCAVVLASENKAWVEGLVGRLNTNVLRLYGSEDTIGVAVGGAVKNIMAIATGLSDGLGYGLNARAALVTRGLAEITRLAVAMGAQPKTMMGLAGIGDLILTCTGALSRNRRVGLGLAEGKELHQVLTEIGHVSEGVSTIEEVFNTACTYQIDMPITQTLLQLIRKELDARRVVERLMEREARFE